MPDPGALQALHQEPAEDEQHDEEREVVQVERAREGTQLDRIVETPGTDADLLQLEALRAAQRVVHLEEGAEEERERNGDQGRVVAAGAQHRDHDQGADQGGDRATREQDQEVRHASRAGEHRGRVPADAEEGCAGEVQYPGVAELDVQPQAGEHHDEHARDEQQGEVVLAEREAQAGDRDQGERLRDPLRSRRQLVERRVRVATAPAATPASTSRASARCDSARRNAQA